MTYSIEKYNWYSKKTVYIGSGYTWEEVRNNCTGYTVDKDCSEDEVITLSNSESDWIYFVTID